jgi:PAS domain S-box-containing protein
VLPSVPDEVQTLRRCLRDLVALSALPAMWAGAGRGPREIAEGLAEAAHGLSRPELVYVRLAGDERIEAVVAGGRLLPPEEARAMGRSLEPLCAQPLPGGVTPLPHPLGQGELSALCVPIGHNRHSGMLIVGSRDPGFPTEVDRLLFTVAANQAVIWSKEARLVAEARDRAESFRALANAVPSMVWTAAPDGAITYANEQWFRYAGISPEANARGWPDLVLHPDDRERCLAAWQRALEQGAEYSVEVRNRRHDGVYRWFLTRAAPARDSQGRIVAWYGTTTDIHERKELEMRLQAQAERLRILAEASTAFARQVHDADGLVRALAGQVSQALGDVCVIRLVADAAHWQDNVVVCHSDPAMADRLQRALAGETSTTDDLTAGLLRSGQPVRLPETTSAQIRAMVQPHYGEFLDLCDVYSLLLAPLKAGGSVFGVAAVARTAAGRPYTEDDQQLLQDLADRAVLALENARLYVAEQRARAEAERLNANLEQRVSHRTSQLRALALRLQSVREVERANIAREIHDQVGGALTGLKMDIARIRRSLPADEESVRSRLISLSESLDDIVRLVRHLATELRPALLDHFGLPAAIEWQTLEFERRSGIPCRLASSVPESLPGLSKTAATAVFRVFQEALTNVARHAQAAEVLVTLALEADHLLLEVRDNGRGFKLQDVRGMRSLGLLGMRERLLPHSGQVEIHAEPGRGTTVRMRVPLKLAVTVPRRESVTANAG